MSLLRIYFIRHAESKANIDSRNLICGRQPSVGLTKKGKEQAKTLGLKLRTQNLKCDVAFCSHARRTQQTAELVLEELDYQGWITIDRDLIEQDAGDWEGLPRSIYSRSDVRKALDEDNWTFVPGDVCKGESQNAVADRMIAVLDKLVRYYSQYPCIKNVFVFSHGLAIKLMLAKWHGLYLQEAHKIPVENTSVTVLRFDQGIYRNPLVPFAGQKGDVLIGADKESLISEDLWNDTTHLC